jgi:ribonuclease HI
VEAFCSDRTASIQVNGQASESRRLPQAGLPQGSPLSPILFLFYNADLVQRRINAHGGAIAFIDDFNAWVTGPTAESNRQGIEAIIDSALEWERRSGATFEADKTAIIHFTRKEYKTDSQPFTIKGQTIQPKDHIKVLGVIIDAKLKYKEHLARAASKGLEAVLELKRLKGLSPATTRQLFTTTVASVVDYASNVWMHKCRYKPAIPLHRVQKIGAQAIVGTFMTAAVRVAEAEASIPTVQDRLWKRVIKLWTDIHTLPATNPLRRNTSRIRKSRPTHRSPLYQVAEALKDIEMEEMEAINPFTLAPWEKRVQTTIDTEIIRQPDTNRAAYVAVSSSARHGMVGFGAAIKTRKHVGDAPTIETLSSTLGPRTEQNPYVGELAAMAHALGQLQLRKYHSITLLTRNKAAVLTLRNPRQQSGQEHICNIYESIAKLKRKCDKIIVVWLPSGEDDELWTCAKEKAKEATRQGKEPQTPVPRARSTTLSVARAKRGTTSSLPDKVGKFSKRVDTALPGKHTQQLYNQCTWKEATVLAQLRTGIARLNSYLVLIKAAPSDQCDCGEARETVEHFLFRCKRWTEHRKEMLQCTETHRSNISFYLGGKSLSDDKNWTPDMKAVRTTIRFAIATGRLDADPWQGNSQ